MKGDSESFSKFGNQFYFGKADCQKDTVIASNLTYPHKSLLKVVHPNSEAGKPSGH
jgi:hypothetical protein